MKWLDPSSFDWEEAPPLSSFQAVATASFLYVAAVLLSTRLSLRFLPPEQENDASSDASKTGLQWKPWFGSDLKGAQFLHNVVLVVSSAIMFFGTVSNCIRRVSLESSDESSLLSWPPFLLCEDPHGESTGKGALYYWSYLYYLSKYYELLDTLLQLARGKPPPHFVLHVYHHAVVLFMAWAWCETAQSLHFIGLAFNTAVHVVMYTYFLQRTITKTVPRWKPLVTLFQIVQFACSFGFLWVTLYVAFVQGHDCSGMTALGLNSVFNLTLFHSFVGVFKTGKKKSKTK